MVKLSAESMDRKADGALPGSVAAVLALVTALTLGASGAAQAAIMEVDATATVDYYHYTTLVNSVVIPTVSYFDSLGPQVPNPLFSPASLAGNSLSYQGGNFYALTFAVAGFAVNDAYYDWPGFGTSSLVTYQGATPAFLNFNQISPAEFSSLQDPWAAVFNGATFAANSNNWPVFYDGIWSTAGDPGLLPNGISITFSGSIHEVPEPPALVLMALGLTALWGAGQRSRRREGARRRDRLIS